MSETALEAREPSARYLVNTQSALLRGFELLATAQGSIRNLRHLILELAIQGKLVSQSTQDGPASTVVEDIQAAKGLTASPKRLVATSAGRLTDLPRGWCWSSLNEIGLISPRNQADDSTIVSFVQMSSVPAAMMQPHLVEARPWRDIKTGFTHFAEGDVGVAKITPCFENGKSTVFRRLDNGIGAGTTELHVVRPLGGVVPEYVLVFLKSPAFLRNGEAVMTGSAGQKRLPRAYFESTPFPLPPLAEQHRIVARVEELMKLCDALEQSGRLADEQHARLTSTLFDALAASESAHALAENWQRVAEHFDLLLDRPEAIGDFDKTILQLAVSGCLIPQRSDDATSPSTAEAASSPEFPFGVPSNWRWTTLGELCALVTSGSRSWKDYYSTEGSIFIRSQDIKADRLEFDNRAFVKLPPTAEGLRTQVRRHDLLITITGANVGKAAVLNEALEDAYVSQHVALVCLHEPQMAVFIHLWLVNAYGGRKLLLGSSYGAKPGLNLKNIKDLPVPLPPLAEQHRIVARVEALRRLCADLRQRLTQARETQSRLADALVAEVA